MTAWKSQQQTCKAGGHIVSEVRKQRKTDADVPLAFFLLFFSAHGRAAPIFNVGLSSPVRVQISRNDVRSFTHFSLLSKCQLGSGIQLICRSDMIQMKLFSGVLQRCPNQPEGRISGSCSFCVSQGR